MALKNITEWHEKMLSEAVQPDINPVAADFLSSETVVLVSGPPKFNTVDALVPIGLVQNFNIQSQKQINQLYEIGSREPFMIPGRTVVSAGISRILFDGPSLMYAMNVKAINADTKTFILNSNPNLFSDDTPHGGDGSFFSNLASAFFNKPLGLGFLMYDGEKQAYGGLYCENTYITSHSLSVASAQTIIAESVGLRITNLRPISLTAMGTTVVTGIDNPQA